MDLKIYTDLSILPSVIDFNFEELRSEIEARLVKYNNLVVTESDIKNAKSDKANLNKLITVIEDRRKEIKKQCLEPYNDFEKKCKELVSLIKAPINKIDVQIKEFDEIKKQKKYDELKICFDNYIGDMADIIEFEKILNPKWGNVTAKIDVLKAEIENNIDRIKKELETLNTEYADKSYKAAVITEYCKEYSMSKALIYAAQLKYNEEKQKKALEKKKSETVQSKIDSASTDHEAVNSQNEPDKISVCQKSDQIIMAGLEDDVQQDPTGSVSFTVTCTRSQLIALRDYMKKNAIVFKVIK